MSKKNDRMKLSTVGMEGGRIYCVVSNTVQVPVGFDVTRGPEMLFRDPNALSIIQPAGRLIAQAAHAVSLARLNMMKRCVMRAYDPEEANSDAYWSPMLQPITTIILGARDSFELCHVMGLLENTDVPVHAFYDSQQPDYGVNASVMTAIATEPVLPEEVAGILDYLPLWRPE